MANKTLRELSKAEYEVDPANKSWKDLEFGAIQRIADALETISKPKGLLMDENLRLGKTNVLLQEEIKRIQEREKRTDGYWRNALAYGVKMERSRNALRGVVTKLKAKVGKR